MMKHCLIFAAAAISLAAHGGVNLVKDADVNKVPLSDEYRVFASTKQGRISSFEEEYTWNRCAKFELVKVDVGADGVTNVNTGIIVGGTAAKPGFPCREKTKYRFSFELKGDAPQVIVVQGSWDAKGKFFGQKATAMQTVRPLPGEWTAYRGELETPEGAVRSALIFHVWGRTPKFSTACVPGTWFMLDKVRIEEVVKGRDVWPSRALVLPEGGVAAADGFRSLAISDEPAHYPSEMRVRATEASLDFAFDFKGGGDFASPEAAKNVWRDNHVELFFETAEKGADLLQLVLGQRGGKWMGGKEADLSSWKGSSERRADGWRCRVSVPWKLLGLNGKPKPGSVIRFNAMREHVVGPDSAFNQKTATRSGFHLSFDDSTFGFVGEEVHNKSRLGVLIFGDDPKYGDDPSAWWYKTERAKEDARIAKLEREPFVVAQVPFHTDPAIPYVPPELYDPKPVLKLRAAVNERTALPVAVANMTDAMEEYRVVLNSGCHFPSEAYETAVPRVGLVREDGGSIGPGRITMRRGVRFRDADAKGHGMRYDVLAKVGEASSVPVASKEAGLVWIQFDCHGVKPGVYRGELVVTPMSAGRKLSKFKLKGVLNGRRVPQVSDDSKSIPVELEVLPFALPEPSAMALNGYATAHSPYRAKFMGEYDSALYIVTPWFFDAKFNDDGSVMEAKMRSFQKPHLEMLNANVRKIGDVPRAMVCYGCYLNFRNFHIAKNNPHIKEGTDAFWRAWREWLKYVDRSMREAGFENDDYLVEVFDEPQAKDFTVELMKRIYSEARKAVPKMRLFSTTGVTFFESVYNDVDAWIFSRYSYDNKDHQSWPGKILAHGGMTSVYSCGTEMRQDLYRYYRMLPWRAAGFGGKFVSIYQTFDPFPAATFREKTDGGIAYDTGTECIPSIRLENLYRGMTDVRYLRLLEETAKRRRGEALAAEALRFAAQSLRDVPARYPHDASKADEFRDKCIDYLLKLGK